MIPPLKVYVQFEVLRYKKNIDIWGARGAILRYDMKLTNVCGGSYQHIQIFEGNVQREWIQVISSGTE